LTKDDLPEVPVIPDVSTFVDKSDIEKLASMDRVNELNTEIESKFKEVRAQLKQIESSNDGKESITELSESLKTLQTEL
jgi:hypothetical protein